MSDREQLIWKGRFPQNGILSLLEVNRALNLAESTSQDLSFGELLDVVGIEAVRDLRLGYGSTEGLPLLRETVAQQAGIAPDLVLTTNGTALALYFLATELCRPGDEVVLFTPCFPPSRDALIGANVWIREVPLRFEDGYQVDLSRFESMLSPKTRLVSLATPQNPSGVTTSPETVDQLLDIMAHKAPEAMLFVDETYRFATYSDGAVPGSFAGRDPRVITGASVSKAYGAPGLRVGWMTTHDSALRDRLIVAKMNIVISGSPLGETLAAHLLSNADEVLGPRRTMLSEALNLVTDWQSDLAEYVEWVRPDCGALCCMRLREEAFTDVAVERFWLSLAPRELQLAPGTWFGEEARLFRLGFGYLSLDVLQEALDRLREVVQDVLSVAVDEVHEGSCIGQECQV